MAKPKNTENVGNYWKEKISLNEEEIIKWVNRMCDIGLFYNIINPSIVYHNLRSYYSSLKKLDPISRKLHNYYFRKLYLKNNCCTYCNKDIEKEFLIKFNCSLNFLPKWCEDHYNKKQWLNIHGNKYSEEANSKRSDKRKIFLESDKGKEYCINLGLNNAITTKNWKDKLTDEEKDTLNKKTSKSQIANIMSGKFDPQKNYHHYHKNECFINDKSYIFRSSWEVLFFISHPLLEYETLRIKYLKSNGKFGVYIPDFIDKNNQIIYELKPKRNYIKQQDKMDSCISWCIENNYKFIWINEDNLIKYFNQNDNKDIRNESFYIKALKGIKN